MGASGLWSRVLKREAGGAGLRRQRRERLPSERVPREPQRPGGGWRWPWETQSDDLARPDAGEPAEPRFGPAQVSAAFARLKDGITDWWRPRPAPRSLGARVLSDLQLRPPAPSTSGQRFRALLVVLPVIAGFAAIGARLHQLQIQEHERWTALAMRQQSRTRPLLPERGPILLQDGERTVPGAVSLQRGSLLVEGDDERDVPEFLARLERALAECGNPLTATERAWLNRRFAGDGVGRSFYFRRRELTADDLAALGGARLPRASLEVEPIRVHPYGALGAQLFGLMKDGAGATGLEKVFEPALRGEPGERQVFLDSRRRELLLPGVGLKPATPGAGLVLTIERTVQAIVDKELAALAEEHEPLGAAAVVVDPGSGRVLAMGSWPTFDPDELAGNFQEALRNRCYSDTYEPGSTIKPLLIGTAWELGKGGPDRPIDCPQSWKFRNRRKRIEDSHLVGSVDEAQVIVESSNVGAVKIASRLTPAELGEALRGFGLGAKTGIGLPGEARGRLPGFEKLSNTDLGSLGQGYAVAVTPLQMALAYGALANGGIRYRPLLVEELRRGDAVLEDFEPQAVTRVLSGGASWLALRQAMSRVVNDPKGTAKRARSKTWAVAGKTGTTKLLVDGRYHPREVVASFCGFAPAERPRIAFCVVAWGPSTRKRRAWGGTVAAPTAGRIAEQVLNYLEVPPSFPVEGGGELSPGTGRPR